MSVKPFAALMLVVKTLRPADGWRCVKLTNTRVVMDHPEHGRKECKIHTRRVDVP